ncbi:MAG TPA: hypothetical protein VGQ76_08995 [Thermoanaerobaculia bacterium]|jgi:hypothetical protein|nr:hypothetical protein [Thermoanaerobaculia bacterium]
MKILRAPLIALLFLIALPASAGIQDKTIIDSGCAGDMTTDGCFSDPTITGYKFNPGEPTVATCTAKGTQRCKYCKPIYTANGALYGYECGYTWEDASCVCSMQNRGNGCTLTGSCDYQEDL